MNRAARPRNLDQVSMSVADSFFWKGGSPERPPVGRGLVTPYISLDGEAKVSLEESSYRDQSEALDRTILVVSLGVLGGGMSFLLAMVFLFIPEWTSPSVFAPGTSVVPARASAPPAHMLIAHRSISYEDMERLSKEGRAAGSRVEEVETGNSTGQAVSIGATIPGSGRRERAELDQPAGEKAGEIAGGGPILPDVVQASPQINAGLTPLPPQQSSGTAAGGALVATGGKGPDLHAGDVAARGNRDHPRKG